MRLVSSSPSPHAVVYAALISLALKTEQKGSTLFASILLVPFYVDSKNNLKNKQFAYGKHVAVWMIREGTNVTHSNDTLPHPESDGKFYDRD